MNSPVDLSIVIINHSQEDLLRNCLASIARTSPPLLVQTIVVDNGSEDDSLQMIQDSFPQVLLIENQENLGFAKANNQAFDVCRGRYVVLLNNDTIVLERALQSLVRFMDQHPQVACVGPQLLNPDGSVQPSCMHFPSLTRSLKNYLFAQITGQGSKYIPKTKDPYVYVDSVTGACMMLRINALERIGPLDEGFFMYAEEMDWCYRANQAGWHIAYLPSSKVTHFGGQTARAAPARFYVERRYSRVRFYLKHYGLRAARTVDHMIRLSTLVRWGFAKGSKRTFYRQILSLYTERIEKLYREEPH